LSSIAGLLDGHSRGRIGRDAPGNPAPASTGQGQPLAGARTCAQGSAATGMDASPGFRLNDVESM
jgi:hypothetical protein